MTQAPRAIVTDAEDRAALSACRALGGAGYDVTMIGTKRLAVGLWSRWCRQRIRLPDPRLDGRGYVERVAEELARKHHDVLLLGSEASLIPISEHRELLDSHVRVGLPPHETVLRSMDKAALADEAEAVGLAPPPTRVCESLEAAKEAAAELGYPVIVKPERSYATRRGQLEHAKVRIAADEPSLREAVEASGTPLILQHYVASPRVVYCSAVRADGRLLGFTFVDMRRTWPPDAGSASMAVTLDPPDGLEAKVDDLMSRIGWEGIFQLQFLDLGGGRFAVIDLNPRLFASIALLTRAGANLPAAWCDHLLGRNSSRLVRPRAGVYYRCEDTELRYAARQALSKNFSAALSVLRPHRPVIYPYFELRDPVPFIARLVELIWRTKAPRPHQ